MHGFETYPSTPPHAEGMEVHSNHLRRPLELGWIFPVIAQAFPRQTYAHLRKRVVAPWQESDSTAARLRVGRTHLLTPHVGCCFAVAVL